MSAPADDRWLDDLFSIIDTGAPAKRRRSTPTVANATFPIDPSVHNADTTAAEFRVVGPITGAREHRIFMWATKRYPPAHLPRRSPADGPVSARRRWTNDTKRIGYRIVTDGEDDVRGKAVIRPELAAGEAVETMKCADPVGLIRATDVVVQTRASPVKILDVPAPCAP
jgi:hypothetical protein